MTTVTKKVKHPYIIQKNGTCSGKPIIQGTRIKVAQIAVEYERMGMTPDEIVQAHPHLTLAQIHDALSYYYENVEEVNDDIRAGEQFIAEVHPKKRGDKLTSNQAITVVYSYLMSFFLVTTGISLCVKAKGR